MEPTKVDLLRRMILDLGNSKVGRFTALTFLDVHSLCESLPHGVLPFEIVLFHALVIVTFPTLSNTDSTHVLQITVDVARNKVVVFVSLVTETEDDVFETGELVFTVGELEGLVGELLAEFNSIIRGFTLTVSSHDKEDGAILRKLVEVVEVILLRVANKGSKTELGLCLLGKTNSVFLSSTGLGTIENYKTLFLMDREARCQYTCQTVLELGYAITYPVLHLRNEVPRISTTRSRL